MKKRVSVFFFVFLLHILPVTVCLSETATGHITKSDVSSRKLTLMMYMCGSNLESNWGLASKQIQEIVEACSGNDYVSVLLFIGGSKSWQTSSYKANESYILEIGKRGMRIVKRTEKKNMGDPDTLSWFITECYQTYPAENYALILWDHGAGPVEGVCFDESYNMDSLSLDELKTALYNSRLPNNQKFAWIGFDACLMACFETIDTCINYADYMIASQETIPGSGWNYSFLTDINESFEAAETGKQIVQSYIAGKKATDLLTLSLISLEKFIDLRLAFDDFINVVNGRLSEKTFSEISYLRVHTKEFGVSTTLYNYDIVDLKDFVERLSPFAPKEADKLLSAINETVIYSNGNRDKSCGISLFSPYHRFDHYHSQESIYTGLPSYAGFINRFETIYKGEPLASWEHLTGFVRDSSDGSSQTVGMKLNEKQLSNYASARCIILEKRPPLLAYSEIYRIEEPILQGETFLSDYAFSAFYVVNEENIPISRPVAYTFVDGFYEIDVLLLKESTYSSFSNGTEPESLNTDVPILGRMRCILNDKTMELEIQDINVFRNSESDNVFNQFGRQSIMDELDQWPIILLDDQNRVQISYPDGSPLPYSKWSECTSDFMDTSLMDSHGVIHSLLDWEIMMKETPTDEDVHRTYEIDNTKPWKIKLIPLSSYEIDLFAQYIITDTQGNEWGSELIPLKNPNVVAESKVSGKSLTTSDFEMEPINIKLIKSKLFTGLLFQLRYKNFSKDSAHSLYGITIELNDILCKDTFFMANELVMSEEEYIVSIRIDIDLIPELKDNTINTINMLPAVLFAGGDKASDPLQYYPVQHWFANLDISALFEKEPAESWLNTIPQIHADSITPLTLNIPLSEEKLALYDNGYAVILLEPSKSFHIQERTDSESSDYSEWIMGPSGFLETNKDGSLETIIPDLLLLPENGEPLSYVSIPLQNAYLILNSVYLFDESEQPALYQGEQIDGYEYKYLLEINLLFDTSGHPIVSRSYYFPNLDNNGNEVEGAELFDEFNQGYLEQKVGYIADGSLVDVTNILTIVRSFEDLCFIPINKWPGQKKIRYAVFYKDGTADEFIFEYPYD